MKINTIIILSSALLLTSCLGRKKSSPVKIGTQESKNTASPDNAPVALVTESSLALKTFNQYNKTLSKATEVDASTPAISVEYELIKNSLPGDHGAATFTPFHQISETRLSFAYCNYFIDNNEGFKTLDYLTLTPASATTKLLDKFIGARPATNPEVYDKFNEIILKIMNNDAGVDANNVAVGKLVPTAIGAVAKKNLTKLACTAILSSAEFTTL
jgi:hypothetical protein